MTWKNMIKGGYGPFEEDDYRRLPPEEAAKELQRKLAPIEKRISSKTQLMASILGRMGDIKIEGTKNQERLYQIYEMLSEIMEDTAEMYKIMYGNIDYKVGTQSDSMANKDWMRDIRDNMFETAKKLKEQAGDLRG